MVVVACALLGNYMEWRGAGGPASSSYSIVIELLDLPLVLVRMNNRDFTTHCYDLTLLGKNL